MNTNKLQTITNLFENKEIRSIWNAKKEKYYFSVIDVIGALSGSDNPSNYWRTLKGRLKNEGNETVTNCDTFKLKAKDGKLRKSDMLDMQGLFRLIESVPSPKAEPFKMWLAKLGKERIDEVFDPEIAMTRAINYYRSKGYSDEWIESRIKGILSRNKLTNAWRDSGINKNYEFAILTNEVYKAYKGIRKESLRDNMSDMEIALTDLGEVTTRELIKKNKPIGLDQNKKIAESGGKAAKVAREYIEEQLGESVISSNNNLVIQYEKEELLENISN